MKLHVLISLTALLLSFASTITQAQTPSISLQVVPSNPTTTTPIRMHLVVQGCVPVESFDYERTASTFDIRVRSADFCDPDSVIPEMHLDIGLLPAGEYAFRYFACGFAPPGEIVCTQTGEETVMVAAAAPPQAVPSLSLFGTWALAASMIVGAGVLLRR